MIVDVYRNLNKEGPNGEPVWSIRHKGLIVGHGINVVISNVQFIVSAAGRHQMFHVKRKRTVHAVARGEWQQDAAPGKGVPVSYNPYKGATFYRKDNDSAVETAESVSFTPQGVFATNPR